MRVVICGAEGQLGCELVDLFSERGNQVNGFDLDLNITDFDLIMEKLPPLKPDLLINAAADIDADEAEKNPEKSLLVNFTGVQNLAIACLKMDCPMAFVSSDYVFDGNKGEAYNEFDETNPQGVYGKAKVASERYLMSVLGRCYIFRTQWLFGKHGRRNFVKSILRNARDRGELTVVTNEVGTPTGARDLAEIMVQVTLSGKFGLYHATNEGICSRFDFAKQILQCADLNDVPVNPVSSEDLNLPCPRPKYSPLDNMCLRLQGFPPSRYYMDPLQEYVTWLLKEGDL